jgi:diguanylate cyclase (GGDEF)-like protein
VETWSVIATDICDADLPCRRVLPLVLSWFVTVGTFLAVAINLAAGYDSDREVERVRESARQKTELRSELASRVLAFVLTDLSFLSQQNELHAWLATGDERVLADLGLEFQHFASEKAFHTQVRLLDETGMEIVRVNRQNGVVSIVPAEDLQNKSSAPYVRDANRLSEGQIFVSMLDLNVEHGEIERPFSPVIRFCMPIWDEAGRRRGMVILNYDARRLLRLVTDVKPDLEAYAVYLIDAQGFYLIGPSPDKEWGFMFPERENYRFQVDFPDAWDDVRGKESGQIMRHGQLITFARTLALPEGTASSTTYRLDGDIGQPLAPDQYRLTVMSVISRKDMLAGASWLARQRGWVTIVVLLVTALASSVVARDTVRKRMAQETIARLAAFDTLTGLPNRNLFMDRMEQAREQAMRYGHPFSLLFIDLNGFKGINDTMGHEMGDELLQGVAARFRSALRSSDTLARLGGDEFVVIVHETTGRESAEAVARKLLTALASPFSLTDGEASVGACIGIAMFDFAESPTVDELIRMADDAMYEAKTTKTSTFRHYAAAREA